MESPEEVVQKMLAPEDEGGWGMSLPSMTISVSSAPGEYMRPTETSGKQHPGLGANMWPRFPPSWTPDAEMPQNAFPEAQERAQELFDTKMTDVMYGICRAAAESKGWIMSELGFRAGGNFSGAIADVGVDKFKRVRQDQVRLQLHFGPFYR